MAIEGDVICYYKSENKKDTKAGEIPLRVAADIQKVDYNKKKNCFQIVTPERIYHIRCDREDELVDWVNSIRKQQAELLYPTQKAAAGATPSATTIAPSAAPAAASPVSASVAQNPVGAGMATPTAPPAQPNHDFGEEKRAGATVDDFDLLKVIGKGSFGKVMLVRKKDTGKVYAMKVLNKRTIIERNEVEHTKSEKSILMKLSHPFLVGLHYSFQTPEQLYFIMDYINGGELFFHLQKDRKFPEDRVRFYAAEIASGLEYLHSAGVIYRDLKPENLLLTNDGHIVMTDFGLSKEGLHSSDDRTATFCGTPEYLAPEILEGARYGKAVDWWSFGTLVFEMLTGLPPFYCEDVQQMYSKIMTAELQIPDSVSPDAADLIRKLLERDPERRLQDPEQIQIHPFFSSIDFNRLVNKAIPPPFVPDVNGESDTSNIDPTFTEETPTLHDEDDPNTGAAPPADNGFDGFTYVPPAK
jgi:serine/threonine protein kinase